MVTKINAAQPPLLVPIGNLHVKDVGAKVASSISVPLGVSLEDVTRDPK